MSITSMTFLFMFLPIALALYFFVDNKMKELFLLVLSLIFYAIGSVEYFVLFSFAVLSAVLIARGISRCSDKKVKKVLLVVGITINVALLGYYKYGSRLLIWENLSSGGATIKDIALPMGISFFTFKSISYLVDVYKEKVVLSANPLNDALYLSIFTQIQSGPLSRYNDMNYDVQKKFNFSLFSNGAYRFIVGFCKKILIANVLSKITIEIFHAPFETLSTSYAWLGSICYSLQLFFDFSGYSDMAIGMTEMFGYKCPENFNYPYITDSVSKFWRRWHITLSNWFRDYIYIPLGGSRNNNKFRVYFNLFVVWILTGVWHGASWNFIVWGIGFFVVIAFEKMFDLPGRLKSKLGKIIYRVFSLVFINIQWVLFNSTDLQSGIRFIKRMVLPYANDLTNMRTLFLIREYGFFIIVAIILSVPTVPTISHRLKKYNTLYTVYKILMAVIVLSAFIWSISFVVAGQNNPFTYANF